MVRAGRHEATSSESSSMVKSIACLFELYQIRLSPLILLMLKFLTVMLRNIDLR